MNIHRFLRMMAVLLLFGLIFYSCQKGDHNQPAQSQYDDSEMIIKDEPEPVSADCMEELIAGQNYSIGWVSTQLNGDILTVTYTIEEPGWYLRETHLDVQYQFVNFPLTKKGSPKVGHFQFAESFSPGDGVTEWIQEVDLTQLDPDDYMQGDYLYIAAHAVVKGPMGSESAWGDGNQFYRGWGSWFKCDPQLMN